MQQSTLVFRRPRSREELRTLLSLRYHVYHESRLKIFAPENDASVDLDCYDLNALHFGLFHVEDGTSVPVGYVRLITDEPGPFYCDLIDVAADNSALTECVFQIPSHPFPLMNYAPASDGIAKLHEELVRNGKRLIEVSRLSLHPSVRSLPVADFMIASTFAITKAHEIDTAIFSCVANHRRIYTRYGFETFPGTDKWFNPYTPETGDWFLLLLLGVQEKLPRLQEGRILRMAHAYEECGGITFSPSFPNKPFLPEKVSVGQNTRALIAA